MAVKTLWNISVLSGAQVFVADSLAISCLSWWSSESSACVPDRNQPSHFRGKKRSWFILHLSRGVVIPMGVSLHKGVAVISCMCLTCLGKCLRSQKCCWQLLIYYLKAIWPRPLAKGSSFGLLGFFDEAKQGFILGRGSREPACSTSDSLAHESISRGIYFKNSEAAVWLKLKCIFPLVLFGLVSSCRL